MRRITFDDLWFPFLREKKMIMLKDFVLLLILQLSNVSEKQKEH